MKLNTYTKNEVIKEFQIHSNDTGSADVQIGILSAQALLLEERLQKSPDDCTARLNLIKLVGQRRKLLDYLNSTNLKRYSEILKKLDIRR